MKRRVIRLLLVLLVLVAGLPVLAELAARCIMYRSTTGANFAVSEWIREFENRRSLPEPRATGSGDGPRELAAFLNSPREIRNLIDEFSAQRITIHNTPLSELKQAAAAARFVDPEYTRLQRDGTFSQFIDAEGHLSNRPRVAYDLFYLRSRIFNRHDPVVFEADAAGSQNGEVLAFRERYALAPRRATIDANGDRITLPSSSASNLILVVGDSMAFGYGVADEETLPSFLQQKYPEIGFVNVGVSGCTPGDNFHRLRRRLALFGARVKGVVYVHCENDFDRKRGDDPGSIVSTLSQILNRHAIGYRVLVYQSYIYRTLPDLFRNNSESDLRRYYSLKHELLGLARGQGLQTVDFHELVDAYRKRQGSPFSGLSLYVDHCHFSAEGNRLVAEALPVPRIPDHAPAAYRGGSAPWIQRLPPP